MKKLKNYVAIFGKCLAGILLTLFYLFTLFWMKWFYYLNGDLFPYLSIFLLPSLLSGFINHQSSLKRIFLRQIPLLLSFLVFSLYLLVSSGLRLWLGWLTDLGPVMIIFLLLSGILTGLGWLIRHRTQTYRFPILLLSTVLLFSFAFLQISRLNFSSYFWIKEGAMSYLSGEDLQNENYDVILNRLFDYFQEEYPYLEYKKIDLNDLILRSRRELKNVRNNREFAHLVNRICQTFKDEHLYLRFPDTYSSYIDSGIRHLNIDQACYISRILPGSPADKSKLNTGMKILSVNGREITTWKYNFFGKAGDQFQLTVESPDGSSGNVTIQLPMKRWSLPEPNITYKKLSGNYGYIKIKLMTVDILDFVPSFDRALNQLWDTDGLIIDIRNNPGGAIILTDQILGRFTSVKVHYGGISKKNKTHCPLYVVPRHPIYQSPVVVLINEWNFSAAEYFAYAAGHLKSVTLAGQPTGGVVSSPSSFWILPGNITLHLVGSGLTDIHGHYVVEDVGATPDVFVNPTLPLLLSGIDPFMTTARKILDTKNGNFYCR